MQAAVAQCHRESAGTLGRGVQLGHRGGPQGGSGKGDLSNGDARCPLGACSQGVHRGAGPGEAAGKVVRPVLLTVTCDFTPELHVQWLDLER